MTDVQQLLQEATSKLRTEADKLRATIAERENAHRQELEPLRGQLTELDEAIARVEGKPPRTPTGIRARRGQNKDAILSAVRKKSGMTAAEISDITGISRATVHATLAKLAKDGQITKKQTSRGVGHSAK
jgi:predicted HTH transcriptional regulator